MLSSVYFSCTFPAATDPYPLCTFWNNRLNAEKYENWQTLFSLALVKNIFYFSYWKYILWFNQKICLCFMFINVLCFRSILRTMMMAEYRTAYPIISIHLKCCFYAMHISLLAWAGVFMLLGLLKKILRTWIYNS